MSDALLSKMMDKQDLVQLAPWVETLQRFDAMAGQHEARWWEYAMALTAISAWTVETNHQEPLWIADVGGHGSKFPHSLVGVTSEDIILIDPSAGPSDIGPRVQVIPKTVEEAAASYMVHGRLDIVTCISVIEHLDHPIRLLRACHMLLKPGGLLFLTTDAWPHEDQDDTAHFHWMRKRIYSPQRLRALARTAQDVGYGRFGKTDWTWHGPTVYDYTFASLALVKK